ncbi:MAG: hypothetical protein O3A15_08830 [Proteobacteria bacterium]|nr:hypothetical protein [Pseudomonadota bacterium]
MSFSLSGCQMGIVSLRAGNYRQPPSVYHRQGAQVALQQSLILQRRHFSVYNLPGGVATINF